MKEFFKFLFASMLGVFLTLIILFFVFLGLVKSMMDFAENEVVAVPNNTILYINFSQPINDRTPTPSLFDVLSPEKSDAIGLNDILKNLEKAKVDPNIDGIYMELGFVQAGISKLEEIREAMIDFKKSGKFIITYSEYMSQGAYYLSTVSDKIYLNPKGMLLFKGLNAQVIFYKGLLEKLSVEAQIVRHGQFKSAVEPYMLDKMSKASRKQTQTYINSIWNSMLRSIAESRNLEVSDLNKIADNLEIFNPELILKNGLIDGLKYKDEVLLEMKELLGIDQDSDISSMSLSKYSNSPSIEINKGRDRITIIYANGTMMAGEGNDDYIGSYGISRAIRKARTDDRVKAIVFRINSGGGDVIASEVIRREIELATKVKPVIASYGDVSASGGYWATCQATKIIAKETCLTGSIGIFGMMPNIQGLLNEKLGITIDNVNTNDNSDFINISRPLSNYEKAVLQANVEKGYENFIELVANARGLRKSFIDSIGQGRVWSGKDALELGLIDEYGGLKRAIELAAEAAELDTYRIRELPAQKDPIQELLQNYMGSTAQTKIMKNELGEAYKYVKIIKEFSSIKGIQARLPFEIIIE